MFKAARWRTEKNKVKAVFKMQFLATQISQPKWESLVVSLTPQESGKPTVRSQKAVVSNGSCQWENPIYETVKFVQVPKSGTIHNNIYRIIVSAAGSPKAAVLGEATIDFADYAKATKPCSVSLPLKAPDCSLLLHVTIRRLQDEVNEREFGERADKIVKPQPWMLKNPLNDRDRQETCTVTCGTKDSSIIENRPPLNGGVQMKFSSNQATVLHAESIHNFEESNSLDTISVSGSESTSELYTPVENGPKHSRDILQDSTSILSPLRNNGHPRQLTNSNLLLANYGDYQRSSTDRSVSSAVDGTMDVSTNSANGNKPRERIDGSDVSINKLKNDLVLTRQVEASELELQSLRKQVVKERRQREDLSRDLCKLKKERDTFRRECEELKAFYRENSDNLVSNRPQFNGMDLTSIIEEIKQELNHEKTLNVNLRLQLQKSEKSNSELMIAVSNLDKLLQQKNRETPSVNHDHMFDKQTENGTSQGRNHGNGFLRLQQFESSTLLCEASSVHEQDAEQYALEELVKEHDMKIEFSLEQEVPDLNNEIESYRKENEELEMQMEQLALDYEILKQENHEISLKLEQIQLREQLGMQYECSAHTSVINDLEFQVETLEKELEKRAEAFETDLAYITEAKVEQEKRTIQLQEALTKAKWKNVTIAESLQEELKRLSIQMSSTFSENEKLSMQALAEASELRLQNSHLEELLEKANVELASVQDLCRAKIEDLSKEIDLSRRKMEQLIIELQEKEEELENKKKSEAERTKGLSEEMMKLKAQVELIVQEKNDLFQHIQQKDDSIEKVEQSKAPVKENEVLPQNKSMERHVSLGQYSLVGGEADEPSEKLNELRLLKEEHESIIRTLNLDLTTLKADHGNLKGSLFENSLEKENLRKQVSHLRDDLQKKKDKITTLEKRLMGNNVKVASLDSNAKICVRKDRSGSMPHYGVSRFHEKVKPLRAEVRVRNEALQDAMLPLEKGLGNGRVELENGFKEPGQNNQGFHGDNGQKEARVMKPQADGYHSEGKNEEILITY